MQGGRSDRDDLVIREVRRRCGQVQPSPVRARILLEDSDGHWCGDRDRHAIDQQLWPCAAGNAIRKCQGSWLWPPKAIPKQ